MAAGLEIIGMHIGQRHLIEMNGIGKHRFCLTIFVCGCVGFKFWSLGILFLVILEICNEKFHRLCTLEINSSSFLALHVSVDSEGCQPLELRSKPDNLCFRHVCEQHRTFIEACAVPLSLKLDSSIVQ